MQFDRKRPVATYGSTWISSFVLAVPFLHVRITIRGTDYIGSFELPSTSQLVCATPQIHPSVAEVSVLVYVSLCYLFLVPCESLCQTVVLEEIATELAGNIRQLGFTDIIRRTDCHITLTEQYIECDD